MVTRACRKKLGRRLDARDQQVITGAGAGDVQRLALGVVDLLQVCVVAHGLNALLQWDDFIVARHRHHRAELQPLREVHRPDRDLAAGGLHVLVEHPGGHPRTLDDSA